MSDTPLVDSCEQAYLRQTGEAINQDAVWVLARKLERELARNVDSTNIIIKCGGSDAIGGCGQDIPILDAYRCSDCEIYFHRDCLRQHCEAWTELTACQQQLCEAAAALDEAHVPREVHAEGGMRFVDLRQRITWLYETLKMTRVLRDFEQFECDKAAKEKS